MQSICRTIHNGTASRPYVYANAVSNPTSHQMLCHKIDTQTDARRCAYAHATSNFPWIEHIFHRTDKQSGYFFVFFFKFKENTNKMQQLRTKKLILGKRWLSQMIIIILWNGKTRMEKKNTFDPVAFRRHQHAGSSVWKPLVRLNRASDYLEYVQHLLNYLLLR